MGLPSRRWDFQDGKLQVPEMGGRIYQRRWDVQDLEVAGHEMGRLVYHRRWDVQDGKWQVMRCED